MRVEIDGVNKTGTIAAGKTGGLQKWKTITKAIHLTAGLRVVTIFFEAGGMSVNKLVFTKAASSAAVRDGSDDLEVEDSSLEVSMYPNPVEDYLQLVVSKEFIGGEAALIDNRGVKITAMPVRSNTLAIDMSSFTSGLYVLRIDNGKRMITRKVIKK
jgi:pectinesterase